MSAKIILSLEPIPSASMPQYEVTEWVRSVLARGADQRHIAMILTLCQITSKHPLDVEKVFDGYRRAIAAASALEGSHGLAEYTAAIQAIVTTLDEVVTNAAERTHEQIARKIYALLEQDDKTLVHIFDSVSRFLTPHRYAE